MKVFKLIGGPLDGQEVNETNATHPKVLHYYIGNRYYHYKLDIEEKIEDGDSIITYRYQPAKGKP